MVDDKIQILINEFAKQGIDVGKIALNLGLSLETTLIILALILLVVITWTYTWKALALWKSAKNNHKLWFVIIFIFLPFSTFGILEILYIYLFSKIKINEQKNNNLIVNNKVTKNYKNTNLNKKIKKKK
ncbi:MAG: DUF5652 family protein [Candidatus Pacearchaeota archaeon]